VLDFLTSTDVGRRVPAEEEATVSEVSEAEVREWEEERGVGAEGKGGREESPLILHPISWQPRGRSRGQATLFLCFFPL